MVLFSWHKKEETPKNDLIDFESMYDGVNELGIRGYKIKCKIPLRSYLEDKQKVENLQRFVYNSICSCFFSKDHRKG